MKTNQHKTVACGIRLLPLITILALPLTGYSDTAAQPATEVVQKQSLKQKVAELLKRAKTGDSEAQVELGDLYADGKSLPKDSVKAATLFREAAAKQIAKAQYRLGLMYAKGEGVPKDSVRALDLFTLSAIDGYDKAQTALGRIYAKGEGVVRDDVLAYSWLNLAAKQGDKDAEALRESVKLSDGLRGEADRLTTQWKRGVKLLREKQEAIVPVQPAAGQ